MAAVLQALQPAIGAVENTAVSDLQHPVAAPIAQHWLALLYGGAAAVLGALVWSGAAAVFGGWAVPAAFGVGWMAAWACRHGGRRADRFVRSSAWVMGAAGTALGLLLLCAFSTMAASPDSGLRAEVVRAELLSYLAAPPWLGSAALLVALMGVARSLRASRLGDGAAAAVHGATPKAEGAFDPSGAPAPSPSDVVGVQRCARPGAVRNESRAA